MAKDLSIRIHRSAPPAVLRTESPVWIEIHRENLINNVRVVKKLSGPATAVAAVVKANAYGHGLEIVAGAIAPHVNMFAVTRIQEALRLREYGIENPLLILGPVAVSELKTAIQTRSLVTISSLEEAYLLNQEAEKINRTVFVHLKIDTGMGRLGLSFKTSERDAIKIAKLPRLQIKGLYTHFPSADEMNSIFTKTQIARFAEVAADLKKKGANVDSIHLANSSGIVTQGAAGGSMVRPGIMLYGALPNSLRGCVEKLDLRPVLSWKAKVILLKDLEKGDTCGYAQAFKASCKTRIAWLPVGYSHGYPFSLSSKSEVLIKGKRYPVVGRISMDFLAVEVGKRASIRVGDTVTLIGKDGDDEITIFELAQRAGTIPYEIMTGIHPSLPRKPLP